eukprot:CAMPEP_0170650844 /NCGR_PEP_ID=MMETSP0224-20130122/46030_1 /TAXON_ID=285029 /ORGANISM="Togula jolla, Strain CCCM 725" /LENGTH=335 /DNA_ID=CAMNT_0010982555 /DNA_START=70 /DNA_END=1077 /DNA_ORIENTATION=+
MMERVVALREALAKANPAYTSSEFSYESQGGPQNPSLEQLRTGLKRLKFQFVDAEQKLRFAELVQRNQEAATAEVSAGATGRKDEQERNKALKKRIAREWEVHGLLGEEVTEVYQQSKRLYEQCTTDLQNAARAAESEGNESDVDMEAIDWEGPHEAAAHEVGRVAQEAVELRREYGDTVARRQDLEEALRRAQAQRRRDQERAAAFRRQAAQETALLSNHEKVEDAERKMGLPRVDFDDERGVVILSGDPRGVGSEGLSGVPESARTIAVSFDQEGCLLRAEAYPQLGLHREAAIAVERDDLGLLLTEVWLRVCHASEVGEGRRRSSVALQGGA